MHPAAATLIGSSGVALLLLAFLLHLLGFVRAYGVATVALAGAVNGGRQRTRDVTKS